MQIENQNDLKKKKDSKSSLLPKTSWLPSNTKILIKSVFDMVTAK